VKVYFDSGKLNEIYSYKNNLMDGLWLTYNEKGIKTAEANYFNDKKHGSWKVWDDNGKLIYLMNYMNGAKSGTWIKYNAKGEEIERKSY
jgi:antitoxin component YwqK of YwqJK toxin-antitoxin module